MSFHVVEESSTEPERPSAFSRVVRACLVLVFLAGSLGAGYFFYETARDWSEPPFESVVLNTPTQVARATARANPSAVPTQPAPEARGTNPTAEPPAAQAGAVVEMPPKVHWERQERVNFLLMGLDLRPGERGAAHTDTLIVVSLDPVGKSVTMLSIPRDLWVPIPGYGENRINTAYALGVLRNYPGGGPGLAKKTVQYNLGIPIHYYVVINFVGFRKLVDALGGITIDVPRDLYDATFPDDRYGYRPLFIPKGRQLMNGDMALAYARTRHVDSDFGRMQRQQQVLKAIKDKGLSLDVITKLPALWAAKEDMAQTDLQFNDILALVQLARDIKTDNIRSAAIDDSMTSDWTTPGGAMVLIPNRDKIRNLVAQLFKAPAPAVHVDDQLKRLANEGARIEVSNGSGSEGLAGRVSEWLKGQGFNVVLVDTAERSDYAQTMLFEAEERPYTRGVLMNLFRVSADRARKSTSLPNQIDLRLVLGRDFNASVLPSSQ